jgi:hypothetical protein
MVTSVTMSGTIMAQRSDFSDQRSFRVTASEIYKWRHQIENFFCKLNEFERIAMRADKTDQSFAANILLAAARKDGTDFQLGRKTQRKRMKAKLREIIAHRPWRAGCGRRVDISGSSLADTKGASIGVPPHSGNDREDQREDGYPSKRPRGVAFHRNHDLPRQQRRQ